MTSRACSTGALIAICLASTFARPQTVDKVPTVGSLLTESYRTIPRSSLARVGYIDFLTELTRVSAETRSDHNGVWCEELINEASILKPSDPNYLPAKKNGIVCLSNTNSMDALRRFRDLTRDTPSDSDEDVRTDAAITVFLNAWNHSRFEALDEIRELAKLSARNGGYPYRAMGRIIRELARVRDGRSVDMATGIFQEALNAYASRTRSFDNTNGEVLDLLESGHFIVPEPEYRKGLRAFVESLISSGTSDKADYAGTIYTSTGQITFRNPDRLLLFRLFPLLSSTDVDEASKLKSLFPEMTNATGDLQSVWQGVIQGGVTPQTSDDLEARMREGRILERLRTLGQLDAHAASDLANELHIPSNRVAGLTYVISAASQSDMVYARELYTHQQDDASKITDTRQKLSVAIALAKSARQVNDEVSFVNLVSAAFDDGEQAFAKAAPHVYERAGYHDLADLVEFGFANHATWLLQRIEAIRDPVLKAYLLVSAAEGLSKQGLVHTAMN